MHELACPSCNATSKFDLRENLFLCPFCSATFSVSKETGQKEIFGEHFIVPNTTDSRQIKDLTLEWLKRLHHSKASVEQEFSVSDIAGFSVPYWIISLEAHTSWKGLIEKRHSSTSPQEGPFNKNHIMETGQFHRSYRWCISARENICEHWGMARLHEPNEKIHVDWDGFPLDSTFSRGRLDPVSGTKENAQGKRVDVSAYNVKEYFDFKFANGLPILNIEVDEEEAMRRAQNQVLRYHHELVKTFNDLTIDCRTELEIAGLQLIHLPFWFAKYYYQPKSFLKHLQKPKERNLILDGFATGVLKGELPVLRKDKLMVNAIVCAVTSIFMFILGLGWHPAFFIVAVFCLIVAAVSASVANKKEPEERDDDPEKTTPLQPSET
jgi:hypothetical protein